jgi:hypothetical protein
MFSLFNFVIAGLVPRLGIKIIHIFRYRLWLQQPSGGVAVNPEVPTASYRKLVQLRGPWTELD